MGAYTDSVRDKYMRGRDKTCISRSVNVQPSSRAAPSPWTEQIEGESSILHHARRPASLAIALCDLCQLVE